MLFLPVDAEAAARLASGMASLVWGRGRWLGLCPSAGADSEAVAFEVGKWGVPRRSGEYLQSRVRGNRTAGGGGAGGLSLHRHACFRSSGFAFGDDADPDCGRCFHRCAVLSPAGSDRGRGCGHRRVFRGHEGCRSIHGECRQSVSEIANGGKTERRPAHSDGMTRAPGGVCGFTRSGPRKEPGRPRPARHLGARAPRLLVFRPRLT